MDMQASHRVAEFLRHRLAVLGLDAVEMAGHQSRLDPQLCAQLVAGTATLPLEHLAEIAAAVKADPLDLLRHYLRDTAPEALAAIEPRLDDAITADELQLVRAFRRFAGGPYLVSQTPEQTTRLRQWLESLQQQPFNRTH
jgi:hypothetical protein